GLRTGSRLGAAAAAGVTFLFQGNLQLFVYASDSLIKCNTDSRPQVRTLTRAVSSGIAAAAAAKEITQNIAKNVAHISAAEIKSAESAGSSASLLKGGMAKLVIAGSFIRVTYYFVSLRSFFKLFFRIFI